MKVSISLPTADVEFLDGYAETHGMVTRSAAVHKAIRLLRAAQLGDAYSEAWRDWEDSGEAEVWDPTVADGLGS